MLSWLLRSNTAHTELPDDEFMKDFVALMTSAFAQQYPERYFGIVAASRRHTTSRALSAWAFAKAEFWPVMPPERTPDRVRERILRPRIPPRGLRRALKTQAGAIIYVTLLEEIITFRKNVTGIDNTIFISPKGNTRHAPRIKMAIDPPDSVDPRSETASIAIADGAVAAGEIAPRLLDQARRFITLNRDVLYPPRTKCVRRAFHDSPHRPDPAPGGRLLRSTPLGACAGWHCRAAVDHSHHCSAHAAPSLTYSRAALPSSRRQPAQNAPPVDPRSAAHRY
jgi:hypothetical protein